MSNKLQLIKSREMVRRVQGRLLEEGRNYSLIEVKQFMDAYMGEIAVAVTSGGAEVALGDMGRLRVKHVEARTGRNPSTGKPMNISAHDRLAFKVSSRYSRI